MHPLLASLTDAAHWRKVRASYLQAARRCKAELVRQGVSDDRVHAALGYWLTRARNAHAFAMGRKPVSDRFLIINQGSAEIGPLYAKEA